MIYAFGHGHLGLTQSAVSAAVSALVARHGVRFFDRVGRRIVLTETGKADTLPRDGALMKLLRERMKD